MEDTKLSNVVRAHVGAYKSENRAVAEQLLADDFTFTSPNDGGIDRATYFERCWPQGEPAGRALSARVAPAEDAAVGFEQNVVVRLRAWR